jgi:hypothetical protein
MTISKELLDELLKGCDRPEDLLGDAGMSVMTSMVSTTAPLTSSTSWAPFSAAVRDGEQREGQQVCHSHYRETRTQIGGLWRTGGVVCPFLADREASST